MVDMLSLQREAEARGRICAVGALIRDEAGRVFVHRRGWDRAFLPGCWDIVGGHVEPGEDLLGALAREVEEETGWTLVGEPALVHVAEWTVPDEPRSPRREFDFLVGVEGDRRRPRLERPRHVEFRWLGADDLDLLAENRDADGGLIRRLVELALRMPPPGGLSRPHTTIVLDTGVAAPLEALRARWDPATAAQIPAHVTVTYPSEIGTVDELCERVAAAASTTRPFRLRLGETAVLGDPRDGVFVTVEDSDGGWRALRSAVLGSMGSSAVEPHVTLVHPRTSGLAPSAWRELAGTSFASEALVREVAVTAFDGRRRPVLASYVLGA